ncbi:glycosyltransferase family 4 protein [Pseudokineococcus sp. 1T1Z-3]|uniref:glycosyltransferase family 4 protein n=1 Tax=Pseudokineococcus sp. 1T1Z-3 TaxID=3132745 RepID=UPI0030A3A165
MRVLLLNDASTPTGGAELQSLRLRELLRERGHEVRLLSSDAHEGGGPPGADVLCRGSTHPRGRVLRETVNPSAVLALRRELASFRPDVVHARMFLTQLSPAVLPLLRDVPTLWHVVYYKAICPRGTKLLPDGRRCPHPAGRVCLAERCVTPQSWALAMVQRRLRARWAGSVDRVVTLSQTMRRRLEAEGVTVDDVVPNGVRERPARPPLSGRPTVAFAGRLVPEKGAHVLVRAMAEVLRAVPTAQLVLVGAGPQEQRLGALAAELLPADAVRATGHLARADAERVLDQAWVQAVPGLWEEPLGNVVLEAGVRGTAVVATTAGGPGEMVEPGRTGLLVEPGSVGGLASALTDLLGDRERCERLGASARGRALAEWTEGTMVDRLLAGYTQMLADGTRRGPGGARSPGGAGR